jgi:hypothetical protein
MSTNLFWKKEENQGKKENRYQKLGFKRNPFPIDPCVKPNSHNELENGNLYLTSLRRSEEEQFKKLVIQQPGQSQAKKICLLMDYAAFRGRGIGKTAFLNHQLRKINSDLGFELTKGNETLFAVYVQPGGEKNERKFWQISRLIFESMFEQDILHIALSRIIAFSGLLKDAVLSQVEKETIKDTILSEEWLENQGVDLVKLNLHLKGLFDENGVDPELTQKILHIKRSNNYFRNHYFNEKTDSFWRSNENRILYNDLVKIFKLAGFTSGLIFLDEAEKIITAQNFQERRSFCDNLRYFFIDGPSENAKESFLRMLLTIHPYSQELLNPHWNAAGLNRFVELGGDSAKHYTIFFNPLNEESALPLAGLYLNASRINPTSLSDTKPFIKGALQDILIKAEGIPGRYLQFLYLAIELAIRESWDVIGNKEIDLVIKSDISERPTQPIENSPFNRTETDLR